METAESRPWGEGAGGGSPLSHEARKLRLCTTFKRLRTPQLGNVDMYSDNYKEQFSSLHIQLHNNNYTWPKKILLLSLTKIKSLAIDVKSKLSIFSL